MISSRSNSTKNDDLGEQYHHTDSRPGVCHRPSFRQFEISRFGNLWNGRVSDLAPFHHGICSLMLLSSRSAFDSQTLSNVAIKKISPFRSLSTCQRTLREIRILQRLKHENVRRLSKVILFQSWQSSYSCSLQVVEIIEILKPTSLDQMRDVFVAKITLIDSLFSLLHLFSYLIQALMDTDLSQIISHQNGSKILSDDHILYFTYQLLRGVKYIHSANV